MMPPPLARLLPFAAYGLFALVFVPLLALSAFNHASAADDYCFADTAVKYGFWQAQKFYYDGWTGRYFSNFLVHGSPLVWGWYGGYRFIPALAATGWVWAAYLFIGELLRGLVAPTSIRRVSVILTALLFFLYVLALSSVVEGFFWLAAVTVYTVPTALMLYWGAVMLRWYRQSPGTLRTMTGVWAGVLVFFIVGCGETHMLLLLGILAAAGFWVLLCDRRLDWRLAVMFAVAVISAWLVIRAPGNAVRMSGGVTAGSVPTALKLSLLWLAKNVPGWLIRTPLLPLSALWLLLGGRYLREGGRPNAFVNLPFWYAALVVAGLLLATVLPSFYATQFITDRAVNVTYAVFLLGWLYLLTTQLARARQLATGTYLPIVLGVTAIWVLFGLWRSQPVKLMYSDLLKGKAAAYDREMTERHNRLIQPPVTDTLRLAPLTVAPATLYVEDMRDSPTHWWNRCQSGYYQHKAIIIDSTLRAPAASL